MAGMTVDLRSRFAGFARLEAHGSSPLYERLALGVAEDGELLSLAASSRADQPAPNLLFAAVHLLLLNGTEHRLAAFYPSVSDRGQAAGDPFPHFRRFCLEHRTEILGLLAERRVQTSVVERCGLLLPAFGVVARRSGGSPLHLVEVGASAGLSLLWDRYRFDYRTGQCCGSASSPVRLEIELRGDVAPPLPEVAPAIAERIGIDLNPLDVEDPDAVQWLRALVWPEARQRMRRLEAAVALARTAPPTLLRGDAIDPLPPVLSRAAPGRVLCVYHAHTIGQFSAEARRRFEGLLGDIGRERDLYWLSDEYFRAVDGQMQPTLTLVSFKQGQRREEILAICDVHGRWLEWLGEAV